MSEKRGRYDTMYDEKHPPKEGIEKDIMEIIGVDESHAPRDFIKEVMKKGYSDTKIREAIWALIDRGYIELTQDRKFRGHKNPIHSGCDIM